MKKNPSLVFLIAVVAAVVLASQIIAAAKSISWQHDYAKALKAAQAAKKPLMVDFYTDWCGWCKRLDEDTYTNSEVVKLSQKFVCVKVDAEANSDVAEKHHVTGYPTILFLNSKGKEVKRITGYEEAKSFARDMRDALKKAK